MHERSEILRKNNNFSCLKFDRTVLSYSHNRTNPTHDVPRSPENCHYFFNGSKFCKLPNNLVRINNLEIMLIDPNESI